MRGGIAMELKQLPYGLYPDKKYQHQKYPHWGLGKVFFDRKGKLKIEFSKAGIKSILSESSASHLVMVPEGADLIGKPVVLDDDQLVILLDAKFLENGNSFYHFFKIAEPRYASASSTEISLAPKSMSSLLLMNEWFKAKKSLPQNSNGIRFSRRDHRTTHCYNCMAKDLDNETDYECLACGWIICHECGACGCGYRHI
jgi:hypothetical protein